MSTYYLKATRSRAATPVDLFPWAAHSSGRYLVDRLGQPVPLLVRNGWAITEIPVADYTLFLNDTQARGFTAIEAWIPGRYEGSANVCRDGSGNYAFSNQLDGQPFTGNFSYANIDDDAPDFSTPNAAYWNNIVAFVAACRARRIAVLFFGAYLGYPTPVQGWMDEMVANGATKMQSYGAFLASTFKSYGNVIWMIGGDRGLLDVPFTAPQIVVERAYIAGLLSAGGLSTLTSAEWRHPSITTDQPDFASNISLNGVYCGGADALTVPSQGALAWAYTPRLPAFLQECPFEPQNSPERRFWWWGFLSTIGGYCAGNDTMDDFTTGWQNFLNTRGWIDCTQLNTLIQSLPWQTLAPANALIAAGGGTANTETQVAVAATAAPITLALVYRPPAHTGTITVTLSGFAGTVLARWFDPTLGSYLAGGSYPNTGTQAFTAPGVNSAGDTDWVLVLGA